MKVTVKILILVLSIALAIGGVMVYAKRVLNLLLHFNQ